MISAIAERSCTTSGSRSCSAIDSASIRSEFPKATVGALFDAFAVCFNRLRSVRKLSGNVEESELRLAETLLMLDSSSSL
jgi:hypothetical protein